MILQAPVGSTSFSAPPAGARLCAEHQPQRKPGRCDWSGDIAALPYFGLVAVPGCAIRDLPDFTALDLFRTLRKYPQRCMPEKCRARVKKLTRKETNDLEVKIAFMEGIVRRAPRYVEALQILGDHYTQRGNYAHSLKVDQRLSRLEPRNPLVFYNLACSYSLTGELDLATSALEKALALGYRDFKWLARDPDLRLLRKHPSYRNIQDKIRRMKVKIA